MRISAIAKHRNSMPKENSKTQQLKRELEKENYRPKIGCKKCKKTNKTLYKINNEYYCKNCLLKEEIKNENK